IILTHVLYSNIEIAAELRFPAVPVNLLHAVNEEGTHMKLRLGGRALLILMLLLSFGSRAAPVLAQGTADLAVTIVADRDKLNPHEQITFTIVATNRGPDDAVLVDVYHYLPDQLQFVSLTCDRGISPDTPACEYQSLAAGASVTSVLVATLK